MPICPNCSYKLVLLSSRLKYKCSLCSKLFSQKEIDNKKFREWNKFQRQLDLETLKLKNKVRLTKEEKLQKARKYNKIWREKNKILYNKIKRNYWNRKSEQLNAKRRERYNIIKEQILNYQKRWQQNNSYNYIIKRRLADLREQQKQIALKIIGGDYSLICNNKTV